ADRPGVRAGGRRGAGQRTARARGRARRMVMPDSRRTPGHMFGRLLPKETTFFDFFAEHARPTVPSTNQLLSLLTTPAPLDAQARRIKEIEHETDVITHRCVEALHRAFITPIERDDIYRLITRMDDIMDFVEAASERISLYELTEMTPEARDLADCLLR